MREAMGNSFIVTLVIAIIGIIIAFLIGSIAYSKAFKIKNMIINTIEKHDGYTEVAREEITANLRSVGYYVNMRRKCPDITADGASIDSIQTLYDGRNDYRYCVYRFNTAKGYYYQVITFMHFDIPVIGDFMEFPVKGESRIIYEDLES